MSDVTLLLSAANRGDASAWNQLFAEFYADLRRLAHARLQRNRTATLLDTTALVHESYMRFLKGGRIQISDRSHFMAYAARVMRSIIVDRARERSAERRGGDASPAALSADAAEPASAVESEILRVNEALNELASISDRLARVVEMRYFAGMTEGEIGEALGITERTVRREWQKARMILADTLARGAP
ncbi:MAG TPA: ECF-type sigma factor [Terriglobales bacterium]|nr:ECF-type sigma factor [Terriglobales bacterium]